MNSYDAYLKMKESYLRLKQQLKQKQKQTGGNPENFWQCSSCLFQQNSMESDKCAVCGAMKQKPEKTRIKNPVPENLFMEGGEREDYANSETSEVDTPAPGWDH